MRTIKHPPKAGSLVEAMRAIGYSLETSLADIVDNSIAAQAGRVDISFADRRNGGPYIAVIDDGIGMTEEHLIQAMRHGSSDPREDRDAGDLGRFGLGMKTASQAQCRLLTVISKVRGSNRFSAAQWDLVHVRKTDDWELQMLSEEDLRDGQSPQRVPGELLEVLQSRESGTIVLWRDLDRLIDSLANDGEAFAARIGEVRPYLGLVFHRFLDGSAKKVEITINSTSIEPHDPFLRRDGVAWDVGRDRIPVPTGSTRGDAHITYEAYVLPALNRLSDVQLRKLTESGGLRRGQGFYVYRADRLLTWGTWFKLVKQRELSKLARVKIDIPNTLDHLWALDIRKSTAIPPTTIREALRKAVETVQDKAARATTHKGFVRRDIASLWNEVVVNNVAFRFEVNMDHPVIKSARSRLGDDAAEALEDIINAIEDSIPYDHIYSAMASDRKDATPTEVPDWLIRIAQDMLQSIVATGGNRGESIQRLMDMQPFSRYPQLRKLLAMENNR